MSAPEEIVETDMPAVLKASRGMWLALEAAELRRLPMPFAARAYAQSPVVNFQFSRRVDVATWAAALDVAELVDEVTHDGTHDQTMFEAVWLDVPIRCVSAIPRAPRC